MTHAISLTGTIGFADRPERPERVTLEVLVDTEGTTTYTVSTGTDADGGHIVATVDREAAWIVAQLAQGIRSLTDRLSRPQAA